MRELREGPLQTVHGEVVELAGRSLPDGRTVVSVVLSDGRDCVEGVWFNQSYAARRFRYGQRVAFSGKPKWYRDHWQMSSPRVRILDGAADQPESQVLPVYALTAELRPQFLRAALARALPEYVDAVTEIVPEELRRQRALPGVREALVDIHRPRDLAAATTARRRFVYEELLVLQTALALRRRELRDRQRAPVLPVTPAIDARARRLFPFALTADQNKAIDEICRDLAGDRPMQRLLQADVGAGKTAVAVYALLVAVANKHQAVLMAPTEVLARQHWRTLEGYLSGSRVRRLLLTGALTTRQRQSALAAIRNNEVDLVVGTQALVQRDVAFSRLGLVVIDEQHKFGVNQRARVRRLGIDPHYLVMTATPIPRTVALTVFGDLDTSVIRELPPGRQPVTTRWLSSAERERIYERVRQACAEGRQAFIIYPLVGESDVVEAASAEQAFTALSARPFRDQRLGLLHGRMEELEKERVMEDFRKRRLDVLVATSAVEVGVDVPNASLLIVEHAERFGLSQLHQFRGRISRAGVPGECYVFADPATEEARARLRAFTRTSDGFELAELDARLRGSGQFFGTKQHGLGELSVADLQVDAELLRLARQDALALVAGDARLQQPANAGLRRAVALRYGKTLELAEIG